MSNSTMPVLEESGRKGNIQSQHLSPVCWTNEAADDRSAGIANCNSLSMLRSAAKKDPGQLSSTVLSQLAFYNIPEA